MLAPRRKLSVQCLNVERAPDLVQQFEEIVAGEYLVKSLLGDCILHLVRIDFPQTEEAAVIEPVAGSDELW